jgi:hypothetical protein
MKFVNKGKKKRKGYHPGTLSGQDSRGPRVRADADPGPGNVLEALVCYLTLQFFGWGSSIRIPASVVFVGTMNVT